MMENVLTGKSKRKSFQGKVWLIFSPTSDRIDTCFPNRTAVTLRRRAPSFRCRERENLSALASASGDFCSVSAPLGEAFAAWIHSEPKKATEKKTRSPQKKVLGPRGALRISLAQHFDPLCLFGALKVFQSERITLLWQSFEAKGGCDALFHFSPIVIEWIPTSASRDLHFFIEFSSFDWQNKRTRAPEPWAGKWKSFSEPGGKLTTFRSSAMSKQKARAGSNRGNRFLSSCKLLIGKMLCIRTEHRRPLINGKKCSSALNCGGGRASVCGKFFFSKCQSDGTKSFG